MGQFTSIIPGSTVDERFTLIRPLGKGSMGSVWRARHLALDIDVAIKFIDSSLTKEMNYVERFRREARAAAQLKSAHVVQVLDYGMDQRGRPFMAMEYLDGLTLGQTLDQHGRLDLETTARVIAHASRGLGKAHALGIVHRDIKPENLFVCEGSEDEPFVLKVLDFGVARAGFAPGGHSTLAGQLIGSPAFMSPEQARGYRTIDHRADLFSLGIVAYQCITGKLPFAGDGLGELLVSICTINPELPSELVSDIPPLVDAWFEKALAKKPHDRFGSAREMSLAFAEALGINASSGVDVTASFSRNSWDRISSTPDLVPEESDTKATRVVNPPRITKRPPTTSMTSSRIQPTSIADALAPLTSVPHTLGVALLDHNDECLLIRGDEKSQATYAAVAQHARTVAETMESIDGAADPTHLSVRFDNSAIYVRWVGPFTLVVLGDEELRGLLLTVGSNKLADRLSAFMSQLGGVEPVANLLRESGIGMPLPDVSTASFPNADSKTTLPSEAAARSPEDEFELPLRSFWGFKKREKKIRRLPNRTPTVPRSPIAKRVAEEKATSSGAPSPIRTNSSPSSPSVRARESCDSGETAALGTTTQTRKNRVRVYRGQVVGGAPEDEPTTKPKKKVRVYRGRVIDEE